MVYLLVIQTWMDSLLLIFVCLIYCLGCIQFWVAYSDWDICFEFVSQLVDLLLPSCC